MSEKHLSTTALSKLMGKETKELFVLLAQGGWIIKVDDHWRLTEKGRFEGGTYINHPKYGEYIAWPESVQQHPLLKLLPEAPLTATNLGHKWDLPARLVNLLLAEKGLINHHIRGWLVTEKGKHLGGHQQFAEQSGIPYVTWPEVIQDDPYLLEALQQLRGEAPGDRPALNGHRVNNPVQRRIDNWLYLARIVHARNYTLHWAQDQLVADYFIPQAQLCIECWGDELAREQNRAAVISNDLEKHALYQKHKVDFIEFRDENIHQIDEILARELLKRQIAVY